MIYEVTVKNKADETYTISPIISEPGIDNMIKAVKKCKEYQKDDLIVGAKIINDGEFPALDSESIAHFMTIRFLAESAATVLDSGRDMPLWKLYRALEICELIREKLDNAQTLLEAQLEEKKLAGEGANTA
jgi:hypothetical protein